MNSSGNPSYDILGDGAVTYPAQQFAQEVQTGIYRELYPDTTSSTGSSTAWAVSKRGNKRLRVTDTGGDLYGDWNLGGGTSSEISLADGSASAPSLNFTSETDLGIYKAGSHSLGITTGVGDTDYLFGSTSANFGAAAFGSGTITTPQIYNGSGSSMVPAYSFSADSKSGVYLASGNQVAVATGGSESMLFTAGANTSFFPLAVPQIYSGSGSQTSPSYSFSTDSSSGIYSTGVGDVSLGVAGTPNFGATATNTFFNKPITMGAAVELADGTSTLPSLSFLTAPAIGLYKNSTSLGSTSLITQPRYYASLTNISSFTQSIPSAGSGTLCIWNTITSLNNMTFTAGGTTINAPLSGWYTITYSVGFASSAVGQRSAWIGIGGTTGYGTCTATPVTGDNTRLTGSWEGFIASGTSIGIYAYQGSGGNLNVTSSFNQNNFTIDYKHE